jgi:hypothetical protein
VAFAAWLERLTGFAGLLGQMQAMGFPATDAAQALVMTGNTGLQQAINWLLEMEGKRGAAGLAAASMDAVAAMALDGDASPSRDQLLAQGAGIAGIMRCAQSCPATRLCPPYWHKHTGRLSYAYTSAYPPAPPQSHTHTHTHAYPYTKTLTYLPSHTHIIRKRTPKHNRQHTETHKHKDRHTYTHIHSCTHILAPASYIYLYAQHC